MNEKRSTISLQGIDLLSFLGHEDGNLRRLEDHFPGTLVLRGNELILRGEAGAIRKMEQVVRELVAWAQAGRRLDRGALDRILDGEALSYEQAEARSIGLDRGERSAVHPRTHGQARYLDVLQSHDIVFAVGPAGTGKTYLAVARAVQAIQSRSVDKIFLVRPAVEAGEQLGFLPGDLQEKVDPYLRPLYDALNECLGSTQMNRLLAAGTIEVAPLAYMRGRTLRRAYVILDEGQNTTLRQMKMFLTRIGEGTKAVVTGDVTQIDLNDPLDSGLIRVRSILDGVEGVAFVDLDEGDVVRHPLVRRIVAAFESSSENGAHGGRES
jgi:phosphate starvation-inducible PhoH-like protein